MNELEEFLRESNAIEDIWDDDSLSQAKIAWEYLMTEKEMSIPVMLKTHKILMLNQKGLRPNEKGYLREVPVYIGGREAMSRKMIRTKLSNLVMNMNDLLKNGQKESIIFKEKIIKKHHIEYEKIHPFVDGNGRTGRMFMNWERLKVGLPLLIIKANERWVYYNWFK